MYKEGGTGWKKDFCIIHLREKYVKEKLTSVCCHWKLGSRLFLRNVKKTICIENRAFS